MSLAYVCVSIYCSFRHSSLEEEKPGTDSRIPFVTISRQSSVRETEC